jgi:shikimate kinase
MGSGKSSVGRLLAKEKKTFFLDTDAMIESSEGKSISDIFSEQGELYFRALENDTVAWLKENVNTAVISAGGGMLVYCKALKEVGTVVYLKVPFKTILSRMNPAELEKRPLFKSPKEAELIYNERNAIYEEQADIIIDADNSIENILDALGHL